MCYLVQLSSGLTASQIIPSALFLAKATLPLPQGTVRILWSPPPHIQSPYLTSIFPFIRYGDIDALAGDEEYMRAHVARGSQHLYTELQDAERLSKLRKSVGDSVPSVSAFDTLLFRSFLHYRLTAHMVHQ